MTIMKVSTAGAEATKAAAVVAVSK